MDDNIHESYQSVQEAVRDTTLMVVLYMSAWSPSKTDRELAKDVGDAREAIASAFSVKKKLFPNDDQSFDQVEAVQRSFRRYHYDHTLSFGGSGTIRDRGPRLLANDLFIPYTEALVAARTAMDTAVGEAVSHYADAVTRAERTLGAAFKPDDYPDPGQLRALFAIEADFIPVPDGRAFRGLPETTLLQLAALTEKKLEIKVQQATEALTVRVVDYVKRMHERLAKLDETVDVEGVRTSGVRDSIFDDARDLVKLIDAYSVTGGVSDGKLGEARVLLNDMGMQDRKSVQHAGTRKSLMQQARETLVVLA